MRAEDPFEMLLRCHRRLEERLQDLAAAKDREAVEEVAHFFGRAVVRHEADEENSLFPRLKGCDAVVAALRAEHREHEKLQDEVREIAAGWPGSQSRLQGLVARLRTAYAAHIEREEKELFPEARKQLGDEVLAEILREMDSRRGR
jgi:hemerythrin-like domain-containing protein